MALDPSHTTASAPLASIRIQRKRSRDGALQKCSNTRKRVIVPSFAMAEGGTTIVDGDPVPNESPNCQPGGSELDFLETVEGRKLAYRKVDGTSPGVVFIHGFGSNMNGQKALALEEYCRGRGTAYVRFDLSGHGQSSEEFTECNVTMWLEDLNSVLQLLTEGPQVLVGSSLGGWLMFLYTMRNPDKICGLIGISAAADYIDHIWKGLDKETKQQVRKSGVYRLPSRDSSEPITITLQLIQDADKYCILNMPGIFLLCHIPSYSNNI